MFLRKPDKNLINTSVVTTHRLADLCCQCVASLDVKLVRMVVASSER